MSTILVVDDMPIFREPIAATLRQEGYVTRCAQNGMEALTMIRQEPPDLILLDIAMPVMDGLSCLRQLRGDPRTRGIPVIMLTAAAERQVVLNAVSAGIQGYLLKSRFSLETMLAQVRKTLESQAASSAGSSRRGEAVGSKPETPPGASVAAAARPPCLSRSEVLAKIRQDFELKGIAPVLQNVLALTSSNRSSLDEVTETVQQDQSLAIRVLRVANSSFFGGGRTVRTIEDAARRIGMSGVRDAAVAILAIESFAGADLGGINAVHFWEHSLASAALAQLLDEAAGDENVRYAFLAAFLHDIGRPILSSRFPDHYRWLLAATAEETVDLMTAEREMFGLTHVDVTDDFLNRAGVHAVVRQAAGLHHLSVERIRRSAGNFACSLAVALADRLAHALVMGDSGSSMLSPIREYVQALRLDSARVRSLVEETVERTQQTKMFYASQGQEQLCESLSDQIRGPASRAIGVGLLQANDELDPLGLFFERLGWLDKRSPKLAVVRVDSEKDLNRKREALAVLEQDVGHQLPVVVVLPEASSVSAGSLAQSRPWAAVSFPCRYQILVKAVVELATADPLTRSTKTNRTSVAGKSEGEGVHSCGGMTSHA
ncbi:MAG: HDOD domain-containing protein [Phycisphaerae bacterium]